MSLPFRLVCGALLLLAGATSCTDDPAPPTTPDAGVITPVDPYPPIVDRTSCSGLTLGAGTYTFTLRHDDRDRTYRIHIPSSYVATQPTPVVIAFHGFSSDAVEQEALSRISQVADEKGFIAVYPFGLNLPEALRQDGGTEDTRSWNAGGCCGPAQIYGVNDVDFVEKLFADLDKRVCVDTRRTYATGLSNGAFFSYRLACDRAARFAAIAPVAGSENNVSCNPSRPVPVMHFHGTADPTIPYDGGVIPFGRPFPSAPTTVAQWAERSGCTGPLQQTYSMGDSTCQTHSGCTAPATLCTVTNGGHTWPGGLMPPEYGYTTKDLDATREMWRFFEAHPRP